MTVYGLTAFPPSLNNTLIHILLQMYRLVLQQNHVLCILVCLARDDIRVRVRSLLMNFHATHHAGNLVHTLQKSRRYVSIRETQRYWRLCENLETNRAFGVVFDQCIMTHSNKCPAEIQAIWWFMGIAQWQWLWARLSLNQRFTIFFSAWHNKYSNQRSEQVALRSHLLALKS